MTDEEFLKPLVLYAVPPREGHMRPALQISRYLILRNFQVTIIGTPDWNHAIESIGATFSPIIGRWTTLNDSCKWPRITRAPTAEARLAASLHDGFVTLMPSGLETVRIALAAMRRQCPGQQIIVLSDTCFSGTLALKMGSDLPPGFEGEYDIKTLGIGVVPVYWADLIRPPWGSGLSFDQTKSGQERNRVAYSKSHDQAAETDGRNVLDMLSCTTTLDELYQKYTPGSGIQRPFWDATTVCHDITLQMGLPSLEYPATTWPEHVRFAGVLPLEPLTQDLIYPEWFGEIRRTGRQNSSHPSRKKVVLVAQGTEVVDHRELVIPTIKAFIDRKDVLVIAILCVRGATLDLSDFPNGLLPANARVIDYFPYDAVLAHADVFVSNSGYGGLTHAISNGVPMLQTGRDFDKPDIGRRIEWSGLGIYLPDPPPSLEAVRDTVDRLLSYERYTKRALELQAEASRFGPLEMIENCLVALAHGHKDFSQQPSLL